MKSLQINKITSNQTTKLVRIDVWWHHYLKLVAANRRASVKQIIEECLGDYYSFEDIESIREKIN